MKFVNVLFVITLVLPLLFFIIPSERYEMVDTRTYIVQPGDTIWGISERHAYYSMDVREYVDLVYSANEGLTDDLRIGQEIQVPVVVKR